MLQIFKGNNSFNEDHNNCKHLWENKSIKCNHYSDKHDNPDTNNSIYLESLKLKEWQAKI